MGSAGGEIVEVRSVGSTAVEEKSEGTEGTSDEEEGSKAAEGGDLEVEEGAGGGAYSRNLL